jgi:hypothetical protein
MPPPQKTMALDLTNLATRSAKSRSSICLGGRLRLGDDLEAAGLGGEVVRRLHQQAAADALQFQLVEPTAERHDEDAQVLLGSERRPGFGGEGRGDQHFDEVLALVHGLTTSMPTSPLKAMMPPKGRGRVGLEGLFIGAEQAAVDGGRRTGWRA